MILIIKHTSIEGPGSIGEFFRDTARNFNVIDLAAGDRLSNNLNDINAVISLGGPMNVYEEDKYPFLKDENEFIKRAIKEEIPFLGICLGAQLLAKSTGAKVKRSPVKEVGWYKVNLTKEAKGDFLFNGLSGELPVFQWHEDTFDIPEGGVLLIEGGVCRNQAFRFGKNAYGLQFHIEITEEMIGLWCQGTKYNAQEMITGINKAKEFFDRQANLIYSNFVKIIEASDKTKVK